MSKDPAFLFYSGDFLAGTFTMNDDQVGKYIRLLCLQHQKENHILSEKDMLNICKSYDEDIFTKFQKSETGHFYNKRLNDEISKREKYSESRRTNRKSIKKDENEVKDMNNICSTYDEHMENENENTPSLFEKGVQGEKPKWAEKFKHFKPFLVYPFEYPEFAEAWDLWISYKSEQHRFSYKKIGEQAALKDIANLSSGNLYHAIELIHNAIAKGHKGIYQISTNGSNNRNVKQPATTFEQIDRIVDAVYGIERIPEPSTGN